MIRLDHLLLGVVSLVISSAPVCAQGEKPGRRGAPASELLFGMSTALTGPAADLGRNMRRGFDAAFLECNSGGGIGGRDLKLVVLDDGYEPERTAPNMHRLIDEYGVLGVLGNVGTPTAIAAIPIANSNRVPFVGAFTGAGVLRKTPPDRYVVNYRASYAEETRAMVNALIGAGLAVDEIAMFTQRDGYGDAGFVGAISALKDAGLDDETRVAHGRYERNSLAIENGLADILQHEPPPRAVIMVGAYAPCAAFIKMALEFGLDVPFLNVSFVGSSSLARSLEGTEARVIITQVVPHPSSDLPVVHDHVRALEALDPEATPNFGSLEGYISARILIMALRDGGPEVTRESIIDSLEGLGRFELGMGKGVRLELSRTGHQACHQVWPTIIDEGDVVPFSWDDLAGILGRDGR